MRLTFSRLNVFRAFELAVDESSPGAPASRWIASIRAAVRRKSFSPEDDAAAVHGLLDGPGGVADDRDPDVERLEERHAESLVLAQAEVDVGHPVEGEELGELDVAGEVDVGDAELRRSSSWSPAR